MGIPFRSLFLQTHPIIGMVHLRPLLGSVAYQGRDQVLHDAIADARALASGGVDAIMIENNYDLPHRVQVLPETIAMYSAAAQAVRDAVHIPLGICVLWNDFHASFAIARAAGAQFVRVPALVDSVRTSYGDVIAAPEKVIASRAALGADDIALLADVHVKHSTLLSTLSLGESTSAAIASGADGIIVTGKWTGDPPALEDLRTVRNVGKTTPVIIGSGATAENVASLLRDADAVIVGTALKYGEMKIKEQEINLKSFDQRIDNERVKRFMSARNALNA